MWRLHQHDLLFCSINGWTFRGREKWYVLTGSASIKEEEKKLKKYLRCQCCSSCVQEGLIVFREPCIFFYVCYDCYNYILTERTLWASLWSYLWYLYTLERSVDRDRKRRRPSFVVFLNPTCDRYNLEKKCVKNRSLACLSTQSALVLLQSLYLNDQLYTLYIVLWNFSVLGHREVKKKCFKDFALII